MTSHQYELCRHCNRPILREVDDEGRVLRDWVHTELDMDGRATGKRFVHCEPLPARAEPGGGRV
jgi:hypothetical protein